MLNRRQFLNRTLQGTTLLAMGNIVPQFIANTALAAEAGKENILVIIEMTGGNDGLNTVIPYADDLYHKARPTLRHTKDKVIKVDDHIGLNPSMTGFRPLLEKGHLAVVQGVGYPNSNRSHFESMDIWQSAEVGRKLSGSGWLARSVPDLQDKRGGIPAMQVGTETLPLALQGAPQGVISLNNNQPFRLHLGQQPRGGGPDFPVAAKVPDTTPTTAPPGQPQNDPVKERELKRKRLIEDLAKSSPTSDPRSLQQFVQRRQLQTYTTLDRLQEVIQEQNNVRFGRNNGSGVLTQKLQLVAQLIRRDFGTRIFYVSIDGFDTHSEQAEPHRKLLSEVSNAIASFYQALGMNINVANNFDAPVATVVSAGPGGGSDDLAKRVVVMTFSEFGRRVQENGSKGTDHGAGSCLFVAGPSVQGGAVGKHPSLSDLDSGDLKHHTDFRQVYATLLDQWLSVDSKAVLGGPFAHVPLLKKA